MRNFGRDIGWVLGVGLAGAGVAMLSVPAAMIFVGCVLLLLTIGGAIAEARGNAPRDTTGRP